MNAAQPILELTRGRVVESTHLGSIAIVDSTGKLLHSYGDPHMVAFLRSAAKPFQSIPFVERGGAEHFNFTQSELSISCASHETAQLHLDTVRAMQVKIGIQENHLQCGAHLPGVYGENGVGIAVKVMDGDASRINDDLESSARVRPAVVLEILRQLKALNESQLRSLVKFGPAKQLKNYRGLLTGEMHPVFDLYA